MSNYSASCTLYTHNPKASQAKNRLAMLRYNEWGSGIKKRRFFMRTYLKNYLKPRFCLQSEQSPTHFNLYRYLIAQGWRPSHKKFAMFSDDNLQFHTQAAETLEYKHLLAELVECYCPQVMPKTYCINDPTWPEILALLADEFYQQDQLYLDQRDGLIWILKPSLLNNGQNIKIFNQLSALEAHFLSSKRLGGAHVLQQYINEPHLLRTHHKYSIRMFVVLSSEGEAYLYSKGYFNVALKPYDLTNLNDLRSHLTNEHLYEEESNVVQIPTDRFELFPQFYLQIKTILEATLGGLKQRYPEAFKTDKNTALAIFGFDFMVDNNLQLWLLEANHGPCFPLSDEHPLQKALYYDFWQAFIHSFVTPLALVKKRWLFKKVVQLFVNSDCSFERLNLDP